MPLHWILMLSVTLLSCLTASSFPTSSYTSVTYEDIKSQIDELKQKQCNQSDATFYSPPGSQKCILSALNCSIQELITLQEECFDKKSKSYRLVQRLKSSLNEILSEFKNKRQQDDKSCFCEVEEIKPYTEFLDNIVTLLQKLNSSKQ